MYKMVFQNWVSPTGLKVINNYFQATGITILAVKRMCSYENNRVHLYVLFTEQALAHYIATIAMQQIETRDKVQLLTTLLIEITDKDAT